MSACCFTSLVANARDSFIQRISFEFWVPKITYCDTDVETNLRQDWFNFQSRFITLTLSAAQNAFGPTQNYGCSQSSAGMQFSHDVDFHFSAQDVSAARVTETKLSLHYVIKVS